jgi:uncharacterized damage-inducible protein DinB
MPSPSSNEHQELLHSLSVVREHVFDALDGLDDQALHRSVLPSGWTCLGLVNHLAIDVERFWFQAVIAGDQAAINAVLRSSDNAWIVGAEVSAETVLNRYRGAIERADAVITSADLNDASAWWPDFFGSWRLESVRAIVLHVIGETATHAGHLDSVRELMDGKQYIVLTD